VAVQCQYTASCQFPLAIGRLKGLLLKFLLSIKFRETDPSGNVARRSNRYVKTSASCTALKAKWDSDTSTLEWTDPDRTPRKAVGIPLSAGLTVYISTVTETGDILLCDNKNPRCGWMGVVQIVDLKDFSAWLYYCDSTVEAVTGATIPQHNISDNMAVIASTSLSQSVLYDENAQSFAYYMNKSVVSQHIIYYLALHCTIAIANLYSMVESAGAKSQMVNPARLKRWYRGPAPDVLLPWISSTHEYWYLASNHGQGST